ncbi:MAG: head GIN domain-containing protein [Planctomycetota bacterium JB042]
MRPRSILLLSFATALAACNVDIKIDGKEKGLAGSGVEATETREVGSFTRVRLDGAGTLELTTGPATPLTLVGDDNLLPRIETTVTDGEFVIRPTESISPEIGLVFTAGAPAITRVECAGAAEISVTGIDVPSFEIVVRGAADVEASGRAESVKVELAGAGTVDTVDLIAQDVTVDSRGAGDIAVFADRTVAVSLAGVGRVDVAGDAEMVRKDVAGLGVVTRR